MAAAAATATPPRSRLLALPLTHGGVPPPANVTGRALWAAVGPCTTAREVELSLEKLHLQARCADAERALAARQSDPEPKVRSLQDALLKAERELVAKNAKHLVAEHKVSTLQDALLKAERELVAKHHERAAQNSMITTGLQHKVRVLEAQCAGAERATQQKVRALQDALNNAESILSRAGPDATELQHRVGVLESELHARDAAIHALEARLVDAADATTVQVALEHDRASKRARVWHDAVVLPYNYPERKPADAAAFPPLELLATSAPRVPTTKLDAAATFLRACVRAAMCRTIRDPTALWRAPGAATWSPEGLAVAAALRERPRPLEFMGMTMLEVAPELCEEHAPRNAHEVALYARYLVMVKRTLEADVHATGCRIAEFNAAFVDAVQTAIVGDNTISKFVSVQPADAFEPVSRPDMWGAVVSGAAASEVQIARASLADELAAFENADVCERRVARVNLGSASSTEAGVTPTEACRVQPGSLLHAASRLAVVLEAHAEHASAVPLPRAARDEFLRAFCGMVSMEDARRAHPELAKLVASDVYKSAVLKRDQMYAAESSIIKHAYVVDALKALLCEVVRVQAVVAAQLR